MPYPSLFAFIQRSHYWGRVRRFRVEHVFSLAQVLDTAIVLAYVGVLVALCFNWRGLQFAAILLLSLLMLVATNNAVRDLPAFEATTQLVRFTGGLSLMVIAFLADKPEGSRWSGIGLGIGAVVL